MNSTFKVVFNKARGALMVVNEVTSSVQAKGTKTVVAAAVATMIAGVAGTAMAEEVAEPAAKSTITVNDDNRFGIEKEDVFDGYTSGSDQYKSGAIYITDGKTTTFKDGVKFTNKPPNRVAAPLKFRPARSISMTPSSRATRPTLGAAPSAWPATPRSI